MLKKEASISVRWSRKSAQAVVEYLLLTMLVVGVIGTIFSRQITNFVTRFTSQKQAYTRVVSQSRMGIPVSWFGGKASDFDSPALGGAGGGDTGGGGTDGATTDGGSTTGGATGPNPNTTGASTGDGSGSDDGKDGGDTSGSTGPGGENVGNKTLMKGSSGGRNNSGNRNGDGVSDEDAANAKDSKRGGKNSGPSGSDESSTGGGSGSKDQDKDEKDKTKDEEDEKAKAGKLGGVEDGTKIESVKKNSNKLRQGGCADLDMKVILQIALVVVLFFLVDSMLFQKRGEE